MTEIVLKVHHGARLEDYVKRAIQDTLRPYVEIPDSWESPVLDALMLSIVVVAAVPKGRHLQETHEQCFADNCMICDGGLSCCVICGGAEASLPTDCPGRPMSNEEKDGVQALTLEYALGNWHTTKPVLFGSSLRAVCVHDGVPRCEGFEITYTPGHPRADWIAVPARQPVVMGARTLGPVESEEPYRYEPITELPAHSFAGPIEPLDEIPF